MNTITQTMRFRQALIKYSLTHGVTKAAIRYKVNRQYVYRWRKRYDGTLQSLADKSHRPHHHPNEHTPEELKLITDMRKRNTNAGLVVFWVKLRQRGYSRSIQCCLRKMAEMNLRCVKNCILGKSRRLFHHRLKKLTMYFRRAIQRTT